MVRTSRVDLRRSIWDLRTRELEQFDLPTALLVSGNQIADGATIRIEIETEGENLAVAGNRRGKYFAHRSGSHDERR